MVSGEVQRHQASYRCDGHVGQNQQGPLERVEHAIQDHEDQQHGDRKHEHQTPRTALLARVLTGPVEVVAGRHGDLLVDLGDSLLHGTAEIAVAHAVLDGDEAAAALAVYLLCAVGDLDMRELCEGDTFP